MTSAMLIASCRLLIRLELLLVDQTGCSSWSKSIVSTFWLRLLMISTSFSECFLDCVHPVSVNEAWGDLLFLGGG
jgi:hypothetical protein